MMAVNFQQTQHDHVDLLFLEYKIELHDIFLKNPKIFIIYKKKFNAQKNL